MQRSVDQSMKKCINLFEKIEMFFKYSKRHTSFETI